MTASDIPFGLSLSIQAGWNQAKKDWEMILSSRKNHCLVAMIGGQPVGTLATVFYPPNIRWVGMVLVEENFRKQGIATRLVERVISKIDKDHSLYLDATPMGEGLYRKVGFEPECNLVRMQFTGSWLMNGKYTENQGSPVTALEKITQLDRQVFGVDRSSILSILSLEYPQMVYSVDDHEEITGFCLGRRGRNHNQIGPLIAMDLGSAQKLLKKALFREIDQSIILDVPCENKVWLDWLRSIGFRDQRTFIRMRLGGNVLKTQVQNYYAAFGPEFG